MKAKWITAIPKREKTSLYIYKKTFNFDGNAKSFNVEISADTRYKFYLNGKEVVYGPCKSSTFVKRYEEIDCAKYLVKGENEILIKVLHVVDLDESRPLYCEYFATANHERAPALYFNGVIVTDNGEEQICSDESFTVSAVDNHAFISRGNMCAGVGAFEDVYGEEIEIPLTTNVMYTPRREGNCIGRGGVREKYVLEKRLIPIIPKRDMIPLKVAKEWTDENGNYCMLLETGRYTTDYVRFEYKAEEGVEIKAHYTECMLTRGEDGKYYKDVRDNLDGVIEGNAYDLLVASGKEQEYETFWYRVFRFIKITCSKSQHILKAILQDAIMILLEMQLTAVLVVLNVLTNYTIKCGKFLKTLLNALPTKLLWTALITSKRNTLAMVGMKAFTLGNILTIAKCKESF